MIERLYSAEEVADYLGVSPATVRMYLRQGCLSGLKIGAGPAARKSHWRVTESALEDFVRSREHADEQASSSTDEDD